jgi:hypothetical protein
MGFWRVSQDGEQELDEGVVRVIVCCPDHVEDEGHVGFGLNFFDYVFGGHSWDGGWLYNETHARGRCS